MQTESEITSVNEGSWLKSLSRRHPLDLHGFWAIADQGVVSLGNFLTTIILARAVSPTAYGVWTVIFGLILFLNVLQASLITYPLSVRLALQDDADMGQLVVASLVLTAVLFLPQALFLFGISSMVGGAALGLWASVGLLFWQVQETTRRALMARLAFRTALVTDAISYLGQAGVLWLLARNGKLSPEAGFAVVGLTCGVAAVVQVIFLGVRLTANVRLREWARSFWETGHWFLGSNLVTNFSIQAVPWALFLFSAPAEAAGFQAISNLLGVSHPIMLSLGNIVVPAAARAQAKDGLLAARRVALRHGTQGGLLLLPYAAALLIFPGQLLGLFYGSSSPYVALDGALRLLTVLYALYYCSVALKFLLNALEINRPQFVVEACSSLLLAGLVVPLVFWFGLPGAIFATGVWLVARLTGNGIILRQAQTQIRTTVVAGASPSLQRRLGCVPPAHAGGTDLALRVEGLSANGERMKVLLVGHACCPDHGSEPGLMWNFAWHLSFANEVWVMTDPRFRPEVERHLGLHPNTNLKFVWVGLPPRWDPRRTPGSDKGLRLHYLFWQRAVLREARLLHRQHNFDVVHHLSWGTISAPPLLWRLPIPFVWGPIGGGQTAPAAFRRYFGSGWRKEVLRTLRVKIVTRLPSLRRAIRESALILSTNPETTQALTAAGARQVRFFPNIGVPEGLMGRPAEARAKRQEIIILWVGRLIPLKGLALALEALSKIEPTLPVRLRVLGDGPIRTEMEKLARSLGVSDRVDFVGAVPWLQMMDHYRDADIFLFTSLRDSAGTVVSEALAHRLPILTLDHQGVGAIVPPEAGIKVAVTNPEETVKALVDGIRRLAQSPELRKEMGDAGWVHAQTMGWQQHAELMTGWYEEIVAGDRINGRCAYAAL